MLPRFVIHFAFLAIVLQSSVSVEDTITPMNQSVSMIRELRTLTSHTYDSLFNHSSDEEKSDDSIQTKSH